MCGELVFRLNSILMISTILNLDIQPSLQDKYILHTTRMMMISVYVIGIEAGDSGVNPVIYIPS